MTRSAKVGEDVNAIKAAVGSFKAIRRLMEAEPRVAATPGLLGSDPRCSAT
ncbi:hypothetical protein ACET9Q_16675 [Aeromonas caviae]|uniref:hypothetical protein n=1 Tax=Aeromonas caviae TaxID=648 RepID=UPI001FC817DF|nr:hypothetical protein [Aeromonas caviae]MDH1840905.1 hypothetical protein [Aeromonas caviae]